METIESVLKEVAKKVLPSFTWVFDSWLDADSQLDRIKSFPAIVVILPVSGTTEIRNGKVYDKENIAVAFINLAKRDSDGEESAAVYNEMKVAGASFINALIKSRAFEGLQGENQYQTIYEKGSAVFTGIMYSLTIKQALGGCIGNG